MYYNYYGLKEAPFSISPNPEYLFMTERHQEALAHLYHGVQSDTGFVLLTGDVGTGKTTVCRRFLENMPENTKVAFILNPFLGGKELLRVICNELKISGVPEKASLLELTECIYHYLLEEHSQGIDTVLLIDEAQHIQFKVLELIRLLTNLETNRRKLLKVILVGQPELNDTLDKPELVQLAQRITTRYHIRPLNAEEIEAYIDYRLRMAGYLSQKKLFSKLVIKSIYKMTRGVPRLINVLCDRALLGTYSQNKATVDQKVLKEAYREIKGHGQDPVPFWTTFSPYDWLGVATVGIVALFVIIVYLFPVQQEEVNTQVHSSTIGVVPLPSLGKMNPDATAAENTGQDEIPRYVYLYYEQATKALLSELDITEVESCTTLSVLNWFCEQVVAEADWSQFTSINRPSVIELSNSTGLYYVIVVGASGENIRILYRGQLQTIPLEKLLADWTGNYTYLWQGPAGFDQVIDDADADHVNWLSKRFARLDKSDKLLATDKFNDLLTKRVILFQRQHALNEGPVERRTLMKLNEQLGIAKTLNRF